MLYLLHFRLSLDYRPNLVLGPYPWRLLVEFSSEFIFSYPCLRFWLLTAFSYEFPSYPLMLELIFPIIILKVTP